MAISPQYQINNPKTVHETIEGETVIVDLATGSYYSLVGVGSIVWTELEAGHSVEEIIRRLCGEYDADPQAIETAVRQLLQELVREQLLAVNTTADGSLPSAPALAHHREPGTVKLQFRAPRLQKFSDMQELLLLDPVHQVDETGWPHTPDTASTQVD